MPVQSTSTQQGLELPDKRPVHGEADALFAVGSGERNGGGGGGGVEDTRRRRRERRGAKKTLSESKAQAVEMANQSCGWDCGIRQRWLERGRCDRAGTPPKAKRSMFATPVQERRTVTVKGAR